MYILNDLVVIAATCWENQPKYFLPVCMFYNRFGALSLFISLDIMCACSLNTTRFGPEMPIYG